MGYYDSPENVEQYIRMAASCDGKWLIDVLRKHLPAGSRVLELGMGAGKDLLMLDEHYQATGSDLSAVFVERFRRLHPNIDVRLLDAITIDTDTRYHGIYTNKVLHHLTRAELLTSLERQGQVLETGGIALHSFWHGDEEGDCHGLRFVYYSESALRALMGSDYDILDVQRYTEIEPEDSFYIVLRKRLSHSEKTAL